MTSENFTMPASKDQNSLRLGRLVDNIISTTARSDDSTARKGLMDTMVSTLWSPFHLVKVVDIDAFL